jgi:hypothetical protein
LALLRRAETVLSHRTDNLLLVLESLNGGGNYVQCLRTAEVLGE